MDQIDDIKTTCCIHFYRHVFRSECNWKRVTAAQLDNFSVFFCQESEQYVLQTIVEKVSHSIVALGTRRNMLERINKPWVSEMSIKPFAYKVHWNFTRELKMAWKWKQLNLEKFDLNWQLRQRKNIMIMFSQGIRRMHVLLFFWVKRLICQSDVAYEKIRK